MIRLPTPLAETPVAPDLIGKLADLGIETVGELLRYAPRRYLQRGHVEDELPEPGSWINVIGLVGRVDVQQMRSKRGSVTKVMVSDQHRSYEVAFFNSPWIARVLRPGLRVGMGGTVKIYKDQVQLSHPEWMVLPDGDADVAASTELFAQAGPKAAGVPVATAEDVEGFQRDIIPLYPATKNVQTWEIWRAIRIVLGVVGTIDDALSPAQRAERGLIRTDDALARIHLPERASDIAAARERLRFDEALAVQTVLAQRRTMLGSHAARVCPHVPGGLEDALLERLPFTLTEGQRQVIGEIGADLAMAAPMNRLLQGEVGSGKTLVSLLAMLRVVDGGHQCAILAPTEVLAAQHYRTVRTMLGDLARAGELGGAAEGTKVTLLTGSMSVPARRQALLDIVTGVSGIVIGTHALLEEKVEFFDLGMVVVDEQHRFGVEQRDTLRNKGRDMIRPHFLVMTATPIPRTVAMITFGDLETSVLTELPRGRQPITTTIVPMAKSAWVQRVWERAAEEIQAGRQVYVVCTRIGDEKSNAEASEISVLDQWQELAAGPLADYSVEYLHGRMPADEKDDVMDRFTAGDVDVLVATTVIEVGVDVPNATMMVIVNAERFGVSQLHQLRGRVGRGRHAGLCLLMTATPDYSLARERLNAVAASTDGFELARVDLQQRREGDILGSLQSGGKSSLHFLSLIDDADVIEDARGLAAEVVGTDLALADHLPLADLVDSILQPAKIDYLDKS